MQLTRFAVKGFKNFRQPVVLDKMGAICVIHGENNVGKSNVLAAMQLFFQLLPQIQHSSPIAQIQQKTASDLNGQGINPGEIFNLDFPEAIELTATFKIEAHELKGAQLDELLPSSEVQIGLKLKYFLGHFEYQVTQFAFAEGTDVTQATATPEQQAYAQHLAVFLAQTGLVHAAADRHRFELIGVDRHISPTEREAVRGIVPHSLRLQLYDLKESVDALQTKRWKLFVNLLQRFDDILGKGEFVAIYNRHTNRANLVFESPSSVRTSIDMLGAGIQQIVAIIARLVISQATFVAIEEPELNLRYTLQQRLREILVEIIKAPEGPQQLWLTSHSPAYEFGEHFYAMRNREEGPMIERRAVTNAENFTQHYVPSIPPTADKRKAALCYVSDEGLMLLPERIRQLLGLEQGGGVMLVDNENGFVELLTDDQFYDLAEPIADEQE